MTAHSPEIMPVGWARMSFSIFIDSITHALADTGVSSSTATIVIVPRGAVRKPSVGKDDQQHAPQMSARSASRGEQLLASR